MKKIVYLLVSILIFSCNKNDSKLEFVIIQINDVYEIGAMQGGKVGGMARVATVYNQLKKENPNTLLVHGGDFLNPSLIGTLKDKNGQRFAGKQMIEVMNAMKFDLVAFGNHEFDLRYNDLQKRLDESTFQWIATNPKYIVNSTKTIPFYSEKNGVKTNIPRTVTFDFKDADGTAIKVGFFSATVPSNPQDYVNYGDMYQDAINAHNVLKPKTDVILGLTHLTLNQDKLIANSLPEVPIIFGGHEHYNMLVPVGNSLISKADANAKTAYVHRITYDKKTKTTTINSELVAIDENVEETKEIARIVQSWNVLLDEKLKAIVKNPYEVIYTTDVPLDGKDIPTRSTQTNLGKLIATSMSKAFGDDKIDAAFLNGGSIRIDDELHGDINGVDIFRVLPFGGGVNKVEIKGDLLERTLQYGRLSAGSGAYLQHHNIKYDSENKLWIVGGKGINKNKIYTVVMTDYLLLGFDIPFLKADAKGIAKVTKNKPEDLASDVRKVVINHIKSLK